jgi:hypothetical protein
MSDIATPAPLYFYLWLDAHFIQERADRTRVGYGKTAEAWMRMEKRARVLGRADDVTMFRRLAQEAEAAEDIAELVTGR